MHGWINLDKPYGMSSAFAVDRVKRLLRRLPSPLEGEGWVGGRRDLAHTAPTPHLNPPPREGRKNKDFKIGHGGTLDPLATGVLPLAVGEATKLVPYAMDKPKAYRFTVTWGEERDTDDGEGVAVHTSDKRPSIAEIEAILPQFTGEIEQVPPAFSAIKQGGTRAYDAARAGEAMELQARKVRVDRLVVVDGGQWTVDGKESCLSTVHRPPSTTFLCACGKGTYIRSLARDMGRMLGVYGYVSMLRRVNVGKFSENNAISLEKLEEMVHNGDLGFITPPQGMLDDILAHSLNADETALLKRGGWLAKPASLPVNVPIACLFEDSLVAMAKAEGNLLKPERVFNII